MIRYKVSHRKLRELIEHYSARWIERAAARTNDIIEKKFFEEENHIWNEVKPVFMEMQKSKCVFCERRLETPDYGKLEHDLEHFRPKSAVAAWPARKNNKLSYGFSTGRPSKRGYYWLAYDVGNYATACKPCNSLLKLNHFPIAGKRGRAKSTIRSLAVERPFLCYPMGNLDTDPEKLISFVATVAVPRVSRGHARRRAEVIIDFFALNDRERLHQERAEMLVILGNSLERRTAGPATPVDDAIIRHCCETEAPHAGCSRAFVRAWINNSLQAQHILDRCKAYVSGLEGIPNLT